MKRKILTIVVMLTVLASSITACTPKDSYLVQVMKLAPENTYIITCMDVQKITEDREFDFIYDYMMDELSYTGIDIEVSDISAFATVETGSDYVYMVIGDFDLEDVRNALIELDVGFIEGEYRGIEIWTDDYETSVAFIDNIIIAGYTDEVEACIRRHKNQASSMYDNEDLKAVADKLPTAAVHSVLGPDVLYDIEVLSSSVCLRNSTSGDEVLDMSGWLKFDSEASAEDAMTEDLEDDLGWEFNATITDVSMSGQFIEFTGEMEIPED
jgi:hypothetical protein